jgi:glycerol-3-phosphate dehydrogenase
MMVLAKAMGSNGRAMSGLAGVGDTLLTCSSELSRNFSAGQRLASGEPPEDLINKKSGPVAEGVASAKSIHDLAAKHGVEMPICEKVYRVLYADLSTHAAQKELQAQPMAMEFPVGCGMVPVVSQSG